MSGMLRPSKGHAYIAGHDVAIEKAEVYRCLGVCPQFDTVWPEMTVQEHLHLYARLKGVPLKVQSAVVRKIASRVYLGAFAEVENCRVPIFYALQSNTSVYVTLTHAYRGYPPSRVTPSPPPPPPPPSPPDGDAFNMRAKALSGGMRRRLSLGVALIGDVRDVTCTPRIMCGPN